MGRPKSFTPLLNSHNSTQKSENIELESLRKKEKGKKKGQEQGIE
jgi:hypothetical protein